MFKRCCISIDNAFKNHEERMVGSKIVTEKSFGKYYKINHIFFNMKRMSMNKMVRLHGHTLLDVHVGMETIVGWPRHEQVCEVIGNIYEHPKLLNNIKK